MKPAFRALIVLAGGAVCSVPFWSSSGRVSDPMKFIVRDSFGPTEIGIERFRVDMGRYPATGEGLNILIHAPQANGERWKGPYIGGTEIPKDPWGHDYIYRAPATKKGFAFEVISLGPDGKISDDDVSSITK